ncbi:MAG: EAL domain-containing protein [Oscillospiraceae bacterium]|nr:EAL domain-containing protein [Oscillospiraceae bacterium]
MLGYIVGMEWDTGIIAYTNLYSEAKNAYQGEYLYTAAEASPFEAFLAQVSDSGFVILKQTAKEETLLQWLKTALDRIHSGSSVVIPVSAGVYAIHESDKDLTAVISDAGQAARAAFEQKDPWLLCTKEILQDYAERKRLLEEMQFGLDSNQFRIYLQFYVDGITRKIVGVESLARWIHPDRGILFPAQFLPLLEQERMVPKLHERMLEESCAFLDRLADMGITDVFLSCRLTQQTFFDPDFPALCQRILEKHNWDRKNLIFELEDGVDRRENKGLGENMEKLKALGVRIASSNFGGNLQLYPVDVLKLNRELVRHLGSRKGDLIVRDMIRTGHNLGLLVVAAGVEKEAQAQKLAALGCDWQKGVYFSVPLPVREAGIMIQEERSVTARSAASEALFET